MVEITFKDDAEEERLDSEVRRMRANGLTEAEMAAELGLQEYQITVRVNRMLRWGTLEAVPRRGKR